jgi:hypothetical protein
MQGLIRVGADQRLILCREPEPAFIATGRLEQPGASTFRQLLDSRRHGLFLANGHFAAQPPSDSRFCYDAKRRGLVILFVHVNATLARLSCPGGIRSVVAESVLVKHPVLILRGIAEYIRFCGIAAGSAAELETQLLLAGRLGYLKGNTAEAVLALHAEVERMLDSLIRSLKAKIDLRP